MITKNKDLYEESDSLGSELDRMGQILKAFEDQIQVLTEQNQNLKETSNVDKLHVKELESQIHSLTDDLQMREKIIEEYELELGIVISEGGDQGDRIRG